jgi:hypothetical protein
MRLSVLQASGLCEALVTSAIGSRNVGARLLIVILYLLFRGDGART